MEPNRNSYDEMWNTPYSGYYGTGAPKKRKSGRGWLIFFVLLLAVSLAVSFFASRYTVRISGEDGKLSMAIVGRDAVQPEPESAPEEKLPLQELEPPADRSETVKAPAEQQTPTREFSEAQMEIAASRPAPQNALPGGELTLQQIYQKMIPSVVSIISVSSGGTSTGTGIVMTEDGYIITNQHVVDGGEVLTVMLQDGIEHPAELVGADTVSDLAVLKIDFEGLTPAEFGDSSLTQVGDTVVAIGDPLGIELRGTMTDGIISAINRDVTTNGRTLTLLQTNAQLNSGNSGGPLINIYGQVIGINTMKMGSYYSGTVEGIGFAIPVSTAKPIVDELIEKGYVSGRPALGIQGDAVPGYAQAYYRLPAGVYVAYVATNSDAYRKGLQEGDIITAINGENITSIDELNTVKNQFVAGDTVTLIIYRSGKYYEADIVLMDQNDAD